MILLPYQPTATKLAVSPNSDPICLNPAPKGHSRANWISPNQALLPKIHTGRAAWRAGIPSAASSLRRKIMTDKHRASGSRCSAIKESLSWDKFKRAYSKIKGTKSNIPCLALFAARQCPPLSALNTSYTSGASSEEMLFINQLSAASSPPLPILLPLLQLFSL